MPFDEDLSEFLDTSDGLADSAVIGTKSVPGIFGRQYVETDEIEGHAPTFLCDRVVANAAAPGGEVVHGTILNIKSTLYQVRGIEPDEVNVSILLILEKAS